MLLAVRPVRVHAEPGGSDSSKRNGRCRLSRRDTIRLPAVGFSSWKVLELNDSLLASTVLDENTPKSRKLAVQRQVTFLDQKSRIPLIVVVD